MKALVIIGIVLFALLLLATALMLVPVRVFINYSGDDLGLYIKIFGIKLGDKGTTPKKSGKNKQSEESEKTESGRAESLGGLKAYIKKHGISKTVVLLAELLSDILKCISDLLGKCVFEHLSLRIICVGSDAAVAAMEYGMVCATVYPVIGYLHTVANIKEKGESVDIRCDYDRDEHELFIDLAVRLRVFYLCAAVIRLMKDNVIGKMQMLFAKENKK